MVVFVHPLPCQSWRHSISAQIILTKLTSATHPKSKLVLMVSHAIVGRLTTWKVPLLLSFQPHCPRECPFSPKVVLRKIQPINVLNDLTLTVLRQAKEPGRTQSHLTRTTISHILRNRSLHNLAQVRRCLK